jgi:ABC-2 type transport system permease protein
MDSARGDLVRSDVIDLPRPGAFVAIASVTWKEWAAFRSHMLVSLFSGPLRFLLMAWIWKATTSSSGGAVGLSTDGLVVYSGLAIVVGFAVFDFADWNLQMLVRTGAYANHLLHPLHHAWYAFSQKLGHRALAMLLEALPVWILVSLFLGRPLVPRNPGWFAVSVLLGFLLMFVVNYASGLAGFWLVRAEGLRRCILLLRDTLSGSVVPLAFFPLSAQPWLYCTPYPWILSIPLGLGTGHVEVAGRIWAPHAGVALQAGVLALSVLVLAALDRVSRAKFLAAGG